MSTTISAHFALSDHNVGEILDSVEDEEYELLPEYEQLLSLENLPTEADKRNLKILNMKMRMGPDAPFGTMKNTLKRVGCYFGQDPDAWILSGPETIEQYERDGNAVTKVTGMYWGSELHLFIKDPFYDPRIPVDWSKPYPEEVEEKEEEDKAVEPGSAPNEEIAAASPEPQIDPNAPIFNVRLREIRDENMWEKILSERPWPMSFRRKRVVEQLFAKLKSADNRMLRWEGAHGVWEIAVKKEAHSDLSTEVMDAVIRQMAATEIKVSLTAAVAMWAITPSTIQRREMTRLGGVKAATNMLRNSLTVTFGKNIKAGEVLPEQRDQMQEYTLGSLFIYSTDRECRVEMMKSDPALELYFTLTQPLPNKTYPNAYDNMEWMVKRRVYAAQTIATILIRDCTIRFTILEGGGLSQILSLLQAGGPGYQMLWLAGAAILQVCVLDDNAMQAIVDRGEVVKFFEDTLAALEEILSKFESARVGDAEAPMMFQVAQYTAQAVWGAAYFTYKTDGRAVKQSSLSWLAQLALRGDHLGHHNNRYSTLEFWHLTNCITSALSAFAMTEYTADLLMFSDGKYRELDEMDPDSPCQSLMNLVRSQIAICWEVHDEGASRVLVAALTGVAYLMLHPVGQTGDDCYSGIYRKRLLIAGGFTLMLDAMETTVEDAHSRSIINKCCAVSLMYLATQVTTEVSAEELSRLMEQIYATQVPEVVEHLMVTLWVLMRNPNLQGMMQGAPPSALTDGKCDIEDQAQDRSREANKALEEMIGVESNIDLHEEEKSEKEEEEKEKEKEPMLTTDEMMQKERKRLIELEERNNWGLKVLLGVAERWVDEVGQEDGTSEDSVCLTKMVEFMVACFWLYLIGPEEDGVVPPRRQNLSEMDHPRGGEKDSWWTLMVPRPMDDLSVVPLKVRSIEVLLKIADYRYACHKKSVQLAAGTLWNLAVRSLAVEHMLLSNGLCSTLLRLVVNEGNVWEPMVRDTAAAFLGELMEEWSSVELIGGMQFVQEALVKLVGTQVPRLQAIGLRVLGHMTFKAPMSCPNPGRAIMATKTNIVEAKIVAKMVSILNTSLKVAFESLQTPRANGEPDNDFDFPSEDEIGHMPMILHALRLLLNISVMEQHQVHIARLVMMPLLRLLPHFVAMIQSHHTSGKTKGLARKITDTANAILQNVAAHPENRTRFYKVELQGVTAAQLEEDQHHFLNNRSTRGRRLPAITPTKKKGIQKTPSSGMPKTVQSLDFERVRRAAEDSSTEPSTHRSLDRLDSFSTGGKKRLPKVKFSASKNMSEMPSEMPSQQSKADMSLMSHYNSSKKDFLEWMQDTFTDPRSEQALQRVTGRVPQRIEHLIPRKELSEVPHPLNQVGPDDWQEDTKHAMPKLATSMRKPLNNIWDLPDDAKIDMGNARWEPPISEYMHPNKKVPLPEVASRLLVTKNPQHAKDDLKEAGEAVRSSKGKPAVQSTETVGQARIPEAVVVDRPGTTNRNKGRLPMTALKAAEVFTEPDILAERVETPPQALAVKIAPKRARTIITFDRDKLETDPLSRKPKLAMFEHIPGSRVYDGLFPEYKLPNGTETHYYYTQGGIVNEMEVLLRQPPRRPNTLQAALQNSIPLDVILAEVAKPPGNGPQLNTYKPVPPCAPLPKQHTLNVKEPNRIEYDAFGSLVEDSLQFIMVSLRTTKKESRITKEKIEVRVQTPRTPWKLPQSIFRPRMKESDARGFYETPKVERRMLEKDWFWLEKKEKFMTMLTRETKAHPTLAEKPEAAVAQVKETIAKNYHNLSKAFEYYASVGSGDPFHIQLNAYTTFLEDSQIPSSDSQFCKRSDCDTTFIVCNYMAEKKGTLYQVNDEHALMRFEFMEMVIRIAILKYGKGQATSDLSAAIEMLIQQNIVPNLPPIAQVNSDDFRKDRLYREEMDILYKSNVNLLKVLYSRYRLPPRSGGLRKKMLQMDGWMEMLDHAGLLDETFTLQEGRLCFLWSRMMVAEEINDYERYTSLTFVDFLDAIGRVADMKMIPTGQEIQDAGYENRLQWMMDERSSGEVKIPRRQSATFGNPSNRPLAEKVAGLLDMIFRNLWFDPKNPEQPYDSGGLLRLLTKIDKSLGS